MSLICQNSTLPCEPTMIDYSNTEVEGIIIPFKVELDESLSNLNPSEGENQRFCYRLTGLGQDNSQFADLSHWVLSICPDITEDQLANVEVTIDSTPQDVVIGGNVEIFNPPDVDPPTGCPGLKFDFGLNKIEGAEDSVGLFCFELTTTYPVGPVNVCLFGGGKTASGLSICGPVCEAPPPPGGCERTVSQLVDICVPITIKPFGIPGDTTTICCGNPRIGTGCPEPRSTEPCTFTVSQLVCVEVPITFGAVACPGEASIDCQEVTAGECVCPTDTE